MKKILVCLLLLSAVFYSEAQITFQKIYGAPTNHGYSANQTPDGGYMIAGCGIDTGTTYYDAYLTKTDANGDALWTKTFGGIYWIDVYSGQLSADGGFIITGTIAAIFGGNNDVYLVKTDTSGNLQWSKTFGGIDSDEGYSVKQTTDGGYIITGYTINTGSNYKDIYLIKTDVNGDTLWTKAFGGIYSDNGYSVQQTTDGGYIITGYTISFGAGSSDVYLIKTDSTGNLIWSKTFGGTDNDEGRSAQQTTDGGYIISGDTRSFGAGDYDVYLIKTDSTGNLIWSKTYGGTNYDWGNSVRQTTDGGYIIAGLTGSFGAGSDDVYLIKTNSNGDTLWTKAFGNSNYNNASSVQQAADGGYIIAGDYQGCAYLIKTDSLGSSGCNERGTMTITTTPPTQVTSPATVVSSANTIVTIPIMVVDSGGTVTTLCTSVGIKEITTDNSFLIYPNPSNDIINVNSTINFPATEIILYDAEGRKVMNKKFDKNASFSVKQLNEGIYFYKIKDAKRNEERGKIVKE